MCGRFCIVVLSLTALLAIGAGQLEATEPNDFDGNGFVDTRDFLFFEICFSLSGPGGDPVFQECRDSFDANSDGDVDLADLAVYQRATGHLPIPLRDTRGDPIHIDSTTPYSGRQTCGGCHDLDVILNGLHFQQGRTDLNGNVIVTDDYFEDGRPWQRGPGRYGHRSEVATQELASKQNENESQIDATTFGWISGGAFNACGGCHAGGGPGEFDRDGELLYNAQTGQFGYELLGKTSNDVKFDGDYSYLDPFTGTLSPAQWDVTGLSGPDCLKCHRSNRTIVDGVDMNHAWRMATLRARTELVDDQNDPVPAFAAAATAGQGWFSKLEMEGDAAAILQIDYSVGVANGTLLAGESGTVSLSPGALRNPPTDQACLACHGQTITSTGAWFDTQDIHYRKLTKRNDDDPGNDIAHDKSTACNYCHPGGPDHNFAKGNMVGREWRDELDWLNFRSCRECHLSDSPIRHPDAPDVPGSALVHLVGDPETGTGPFDVLSCQACHIPYTLHMPGLLFAHSTVTGLPAFGFAATYYSADPLNPSDPDKSRWYPTLIWKLDSDGVERLFPALHLSVIYWADWDQNGTPGSLSDDTLTPILQWRIFQITGGAPLPGVTDDSGDGQLEINRPEEILTYIQALKGNDRYGRQVASRPVFVKNGEVWYQDPQDPASVGSFELEGSGISDAWQFYYMGIDHNVLAKEQAWGYHPTNPEEGCRDCHRPETLDSPVFDRLILVDPYGPDGQPVYTTVRELTGANPP